MYIVLTVCGEVGLSFERNALKNQDEQGPPKKWDGTLHPILFFEMATISKVN